MRGSATALVSVIGNATATNPNSIACKRAVRLRGPFFRLSHIHLSGAKEALPGQGLPVRSLGFGMVNKLVVAFMGLLSCTAAHADCSAQSGTRRPHLVELYTSEGCSSCPPADKWLQRLHNADAVALAFHVDYWDELGWRDRFADPRYSARQQTQARRDAGTSVYTPQVVLDGHSWSNWYRQGALAPAPNGAAKMKIAMTGSAPALRVHTEVTPAEGVDLTDYRTYIALTENGLSSNVRAGENRGVLLKHDHVVRTFAGPLATTQGDAEIVVPADVDLAHSTLVAFAQRADDGAVAQVVTLPLAQCR